MEAPKWDRVQRAVLRLRQALDELERTLAGSGGEVETANVVKRRMALLAEIHRRGSVDRKTLWPLLKKHKAQPQWIGMQVKVGLLALYAGPDGQDRYSVTSKAIKLYDLDQAEDGKAGGAGT